VTLLASGGGSGVGLIAQPAAPFLARRLTSLRSGFGSAALGIAASGIAVLGVAHLHVAGRPATMCPLRALTGIPCPICGGTTAAVRLGHLDLMGALAANPVVVLFGVAIVASPLILGRGGLARLGAAQRTKLSRLMIVALAFSEVWQLVRFGIW
jgi:hypothetical protein